MDRNCVLIDADAAFELSAKGMTAVKIVMARSDEQFDMNAARIVTEQLLKKPDSIICLDVTLNTQPIINKLVEYSALLQLDWADTRVCTTYEFVNVDEDQTSGVANRMEALLSRVNINRDNVFIPQSIGSSAEVSQSTYRAAIKAFGSVDVTILELDSDGVIAMNPPGTSLNEEVYVANVDSNRFNRKAHFDKNQYHPTRAVTLGPKLLMHTSHLVLIAKGTDKARLVKDALTGPITPNLPASVVQLHPNLTVLLDESAASMMW